MKKLLVLVLIFMLVSGSACVKQPAAPATATEASPAAGAAAEEPTQAVPVKDTLIIGQYGDTPNLDSYDNLNDNGMRVNMAIYDPLVRMDSATLEIKPCLAESWTISDDGMVYVFKIKEGVKLSDGSDFTAEDVVFSIKRGMEMPMAISYGRIVDVALADQNSVKITLDGPNSGFLYLLALPTAGMMSKAKITELGEEKYFEKPITTGPYVVSEWKVGEKVVLEANPYYHMGVPAIKHVEFVVIGDPNAAVLSLESGDIDAYVDIPQSSFKRVEADDSLTLYSGGAFGFDWLVLNMSRPIFSKLAARQAMAYAVDKQSILDGIYDGHGTIADTVARPEYLGYTDKIKTYPYDVEKAKALFAEAGVTENDTIEIVFVQPNRSKIAQVLQDSLSQIGITAHLQQLERSAFDDAALSGTADIYVAGSTFAAPSIDEAVYDAVHSNSFQVRNYSKYVSAEADSLLDTARTTVDDAERAALYSRLLILLSEDLPVIPIVWNTKNIAANKDLHGVAVNPWSFYNPFEFSW